MDLPSGVKKREAAVLAEDGQERGRSSLGLGVCVPALGVGQRVLLRAHGQEHKQTWGAGFLMLRAHPFVGSNG